MTDRIFGKGHKNKVRRKQRRRRKLIKRGEGGISPNVAPRRPRPELSRSDSLVDASVATKS